MYSVRMAPPYTKSRADNSRPLLPLPHLLLQERRHVGPVGTHGVEGVVAAPGGVAGDAGGASRGRPLAAPSILPRPRAGARRTRARRSARPGAATTAASAPMEKP